MKFPIVLSAKASADLKGAIDWYDTQAAGLGDIFWEDAKILFNHISEFPLAGTPVAGELRRGLIHRFHYAVIYRFKAKKILVVRVIHCANQLHQNMVK